jgi:hypothetical protein
MRETSGCNQAWQILMSQLAAGELEGDARTTAEAHRQRCASCQQQFLKLRELDSLFDRLRAQAPESEAADAPDPMLALALSEAKRRRDDKLESTTVDLPPSRVSSLRLKIRHFIQDLAVDVHDLPAWITMPTILLSATFAAFVISRPAHLLQPGELEQRTALQANASTRNSGMTTNHAWPVSLAFAVKEADGEIKSGRDGGRYESADVLYFRAHLPSKGHLMLVRIGEDGVEPIRVPGQSSPLAEVAPGHWDLSDGQELVGIPLQGLKGSQRFVALFSDREFELDDHILEQIRREPARTSANSPTLQYDSLVVKVRD